MAKRHWALGLAAAAALAIGAGFWARPSRALTPTAPAKVEAHAPPKRKRKPPTLLVPPPTPPPTSNLIKYQAKLNIHFLFVYRWVADLSFSFPLSRLRSSSL